MNVCKKCGDQFEHSTSGRRLYCHICRPVRIDTRRRYQPTGIVRVQLVRGDCGQCGSEFVGPTHQKWCSRICSDRAKGERRGARKGRFCADCGRPVQSGDRDAKRPARCRPCAQAKPSANTRGKLRKDGKPRGSGPQIWSCERCGDDWERESCRGQVPRWCPKCRHMAGFERRRARIAGAFVADVNRTRVFEADGWRCHLCGMLIDRSQKAPDRMSASIDHVIPLSRGGKHEPSNCRAAHLGCNAKKSNRGGGEQLLLLAV